MRSVAFAMVLYVAVLSGEIYAGEDGLMALRGHPPAGTAAVNRFEKIRPEAAESVKRETRDIPAYLGWKESCVPGLIHLADGAVKWNGNAGFNLTPRFVVRESGSSPGAFLDGFVKELAGL